MIRYEIRQAILTLKAQGRGVREISRILKVSRNTVRRALREPESKAPSGPSGQEALSELLPEIYPRCKGHAVRIQEILAEKHAIEIPYSTLTRLIREQDLREPRRRSGIYTFGPGEEMQHDTSPHRLELAGKWITTQCASITGCALRSPPRDRPPSSGPRPCRPRANARNLGTAE
jgi:transposase